MSFDKIEKIMENAERTIINLEKCRHLDINMFNEIRIYKQNVEGFLSFDEKSGNLDDYINLYFWLLHNKNNIRVILQDVLRKLEHDQVHANKDVVFLDDYVNPENLLEDINCIKKELLFIDNILLDMIYRKLYVSLDNNKQIYDTYINHYKNKTNAISNNYKVYRYNIMTMFSLFSNRTDKGFNIKYKDWLDYSVLDTNVKRKMIYDLRNKSRTFNFTTNTKKLWGTRDLILYFENILLIDQKNYSDVKFLLEYDIIEKMGELLSVGIFRVVFVSNQFKNKNDEFLYMLSLNKSNVTFKNKFRYSKNFVIKFTSLDTLIAETRDKLFFESFTEDTELKDINRNINVEYSKSIFIFRDIDWNDIVYRFKQNKITISTGMNNRKGELSSLDFKYSELLQKMYGSKDAYRILKYSNLFHKTIKNSENKVDKVVDVVPYKKPLTVSEYRFDFYEFVENHKPKENDILFELLDIEDNSFPIEDMDSDDYDWDVIADINKNEDRVARLERINRMSNPILNESVESKKHVINNSLKNDNNILGINKKRKYHTLINQRRNYSSENLSTERSSDYINNVNNSEKENKLKDEKSSTKNLNVLNLYMENLRLLLNNKEKSWEEKQIHLEKEWSSYNTDLDIYSEEFRKKNITSGSFSKYIKKAAITLQLKMDDGSIKKRLGKKVKKGVISEKSQKNEYYTYLNNKKYLWLTISIATTIYSRKNISWTSACSTIGNRILESIWVEICDDPNFFDSDILKGNNFIDEENLDSIKNNKKILYFKMKCFNYEDFLKYFSIENVNIEAINIGDFFLEMLSNEPHMLFERVPHISEENGHVWPTLTLGIKDNIFEEIKKNLIPSNFTVPMVFKPLEWSDDHKGGQLLMSKKDSYSIITGSLMEGHSLLNRGLIYKTVNILSSLEFTVNTDLLDYLETSEGQNFINIEIKKMDKSEHLQFKYTLDLAKTFYKIKFYLTLKCDWRGRLYVTPFYLNYQGSEFNKSLVYMAKGEKLNEKGYEKMCIYGATLFNEDSMGRKNNNQKLEWTKNNLEKICKIDFDFIQKAENKWLFLAFCLIMKKYREDKNCIVNFPIYIDATCSGIQHVGAMIEDLDLAKSVNLIFDKKNDEVQDIYTSLLEPINKEIKRVGLTDENYPNLRFIVLTREESKPGIMTKTYNVTLKGMAGQLVKVSLKTMWKKEFDEKTQTEYNKFYIVLPYEGSDKEILLSYKDIFKIAEIIEKNIFSKYTALEKVYTYFKDICKVMNSLNLPVTWFTPAGTVVTQQYFKTNENKLSYYYGGKAKVMILRENTKELDKRGQVNGIIPNVIHSLDASHLLKIIISAKEKNINYVLPIHDCFGTHPNDVDKLFDLLKIEFVKLYANEKFLTKFHKDIKQSIKNNQGQFIKKKGFEKVTMPDLNRSFYFPVIPEHGEFNINEILDSKYMFI